MPRLPIPAGWRSSTNSCLPTRRRRNCKGCCRCPSNLMAHHLGVLEQAGMVRRIRSEGDRRRTYLQLIPEALEVMVPCGCGGRRTAWCLCVVRTRPAVSWPSRCGSVTARCRRHRRAPIPPPRFIPARWPRPGVGTYRYVHARRATSTMSSAPGTCWSRYATTLTKNCPPTCTTSTGRFPTRCPPRTPTRSIGPSTT